MKDIESKVHAYVDTLERLNKEQGGTPLHYMIQITPRPSQEETHEGQQWLHVLGDRLTAKTNTEMRLELCLLQDYLKRGTQLLKRMEELEKWTSSNKGIDWDNITNELATSDFSVLQHDWMHSNSFR